ncbi:GNAT family N-acetyltransferase [Virgibacillus profundi]|uniref:GNAT family N-acetyltransferase n=1 Tax=Virgibacillus profundi TaxID=2024555 RepID=A0A2A2IEV5_9BACI|nr:GNAT family N-acetyltransferase [Virgibacillus profundi]PAV29675.1 GNAT family N-acetyltransferase [Virgibacillus profundi]PXY53847.1 N-acetyltransferase [Virgibacillus profundi]
MGFTIRKMKRSDIAQVQHVAKSSWHATYEGIIPRNIQNNFLDAAYSDEAMKQRLEGSHIFVVESDGTVFGFANYSPVTKDGKSELGAIYLLPDYQGSGAGTALLREGINELEGIKEIYINVEKDNEIGKNFYQAKGFEVVSEFDDNFDGHILKTIRMVLKVK